MGHCNRTLAWLCQFLHDVHPFDSPERMAKKWGFNLLAHWPFEDLGVWLHGSSPRSLVSVFSRGDYFNSETRLEVPAEGALASLVQAGGGVFTNPEESFPVVAKKGHDAALKILLVPIRGTSRVKLGIVAAVFKPEGIPGGEFGAFEFLKASTSVLGVLLEKYSMQKLQFDMLKCQLSSLDQIVKKNHKGLRPLLSDTCLERRLAVSDLPILIFGESGSGKTTQARRLHEMSPRKDGPFIVLDLEALPQNEIDPEIFGAEGETQDRLLNPKYGKLELANGGTLVLEGVSALPLGVQAKLLTFLEQNRFERSGGQDILEADVRILVTSEVPLEQELESGRLRRDLFYKLNTTKLHLPPLRERRSEIRGFVEAIIKDLSDKYGHPKKATKELLSWATRYSWPGNFRQLDSVLEYAFVMADDFIGLEHLPPDIQESLGFKKASRRGRALLSEKDLGGDLDQIQRVLSRNRWILSKAARELGMTRRQLEYRVKKFNLWPQEGA